MRISCRLVLKWPKRPKRAIPDLKRNTLNQMTRRADCAPFSWFKRLLFARLFIDDAW